MKKSLLAIAVVVTFALAAAAQTGNMSSKSGTEKSAASTGKTHSLTGCLEQGTSPGTYVIKNARHPAGVQVSYSGSEDLSKHVGHKVHVTGSMSGDTMDATTFKHISATCSVGTASGGHHSNKSNVSTGSTNPK